MLLLSQPRPGMSVCYWFLVRHAKTVGRIRIDTWCVVTLGAADVRLPYAFKSYYYWLLHLKRIFRNIQPGWDYQVGRWE